MIKWEQNDVFVLIKAQIDDKLITFRLDDDIIIHLINNTPPIYYFTIFFEGKTLTEIVNFDKLKPIIKKSSKLSVKIGQTTKNQNIVSKKIDGYYSIMRGESFIERYLSNIGWNKQEYRFSFYLWDEKQNLEQKIQNTEINYNVTAEIPAEPKNQIVCSNCNAILELDYDICPVCFNYRLKREPDVEIQL